MKQAIFTTYENRLAELRSQHEAGTITAEQHQAERVKALWIYTAGMALEEYRMSQITLAELVEKINLTLKGKINHD